MKKTGGKATFNKTTGQWESQPVCYVEFHCTPEEWHKLGNGQQYLVRDWVKSHNWEEMIYQNNCPIMDVINMAVNEIICDRYELTVSRTSLGHWQVVVAGAPYPAYVYPYTGEYMPDIFGFRIKQIDLIFAICSICKAIFALIYSVQHYPHYLKKYQSGEFKVEVLAPSVDIIRKKELSD